MSSSNAWNRAEDGFHRSSVTPQVRCRRNFELQYNKTMIIMWKRLLVNVKHAEEEGVKDHLL